MDAKKGNFDHRKTLSIFELDPELLHAGRIGEYLQRHREATDDNASDHFELHSQDFYITVSGKNTDSRPEDDTESLLSTPAKAKARLTEIGSLSSSSSESSQGDFFQVNTNKFSLPPRGNTYSNRPNANTQLSKKDVRNSGVSKRLFASINPSQGLSATSQVSSSFEESNAQSLTPTQSPPSQVGNKVSEFDPNRIQSLVPASSSTQQAEWDVSSTDSMFSVQVEDNSFLKDEVVEVRRDRNRSRDAMKSWDMIVFTPPPSIPLMKSYDIISPENKSLASTSQIPIYPKSPTLQNLTPIQPPPIQAMDRAGEYNPKRIPSFVFARKKSTTPVEWSVASNESLFSIHVGNNSFSKDKFNIGGRENDRPLERSKSKDTIVYSPAPSIHVEEAKDNGSVPEMELDKRGEAEDIREVTTLYQSMAKENLPRPDAGVRSGDPFSFPVKKKTKKKCSWLSCHCCRFSSPQCSCPTCSCSHGCPKCSCPTCDCCSCTCPKCSWPSCNCCSCSCLKCSWPSCNCCSRSCLKCSSPSCNGCTCCCSKCGWPSCHCSSCRPNCACQSCCCSSCGCPACSSLLCCSSSCSCSKCNWSSCCSSSCGFSKCAWTCQCCNCNHGSCCFHWPSCVCSWGCCSRCRRKKSKYSPADSMQQLASEKTYGSKKKWFHRLFC